MPSTTRMQWPFPSENQDPWYDAIEGYFSAADASGYAGRENDTAILTEGGTLSFNDVTGVVDWSGTIGILSAYVGFRWNIAAGQATLQDGQILYVNLTRAPTKSLTVTPSVAYQLPLTDNSFIIGVRIGSTFYLRNGASIPGGSSISPITGSSGGGSGSGDAFSGTIQTADATVTTIATIATTVNDSVIIVDASFVGIDKTANHVFEQGSRALVLRDEVGTLTIQNVNNYSVYDTDDPTWAATVVDDGGSNILLRVQGDATNAVHWFVSGTSKVHY